MTFWGKSRSRLTSRCLTALFTVCATTAGLSSCGSGASDNATQAGFVKGRNGVDTVPTANRKPAPDISGKTTTGKKLNIDEYKGKVIVLNIWGSWCGPCIAEAPNFTKIAKETNKQGVQFIGINTRDSNPAQAISFEEQHKIPYPSLYDPTGKLMLRFPKGSLNPQFIPSTIAIDRHGRTAARSIGPLGETELRKMIEPLIAEK